MEKRMTMLDRQMERRRKKGMEIYGEEEDQDTVKDMENEKEYYKALITNICEAYAHVIRQIFEYVVLLKEKKLKHMEQGISHTESLSDIYPDQDLPAEQIKRLQDVKNHVRQKAENKTYDEIKYGNIVTTLRDTIGFNITEVAEENLPERIEAACLTRYGYRMKNTSENIRSFTTNTDNYHTRFKLVSVNDLLQDVKSFIQLDQNLMVIDFRI